MTTTTTAAPAAQAKPCAQTFTSYGKFRHRPKSAINILRELRKRTCGRFGNERELMVRWVVEPFLERIETLPVSKVDRELMDDPELRQIFFEGMTRAFDRVLRENKRVSIARLVKFFQEDGQAHVARMAILRGTPHE